MALEFAFGAELNTTIANINNEHPNLSWFGGITTGISIITSQIRTGTYALDGLATGQANLVFSPLSSDQSKFLKVSVAFVAFPDIECFLTDLTSSNGVYEGFITIGSDGKLRLYYSDTGGGSTQIGSETEALSLNKFYDVELHVNSTGGNASTLVEAKLNGSIIGSSTVAIFATSTGMASGIADLNWYGRGSTPTSGEWIFDDWIVVDSSGSAMQTYPGTARVFRSIPNAAGDANTFATQTGGTAGAGNNFTRVNESPPDDVTTYNGSSTLNQEDCLNTSDPGLGMYDVIKAVQVMGRYRNSTADATAALKFGIKKAASGTLAQGAAIVPNSTSWITTTAAGSLISYLDPDGGAWSQKTLATMQLDYKLTTAPGTAGRRIDVTNIWAYVIYVPYNPISRNINQAVRRAAFY